MKYILASEPRRRTHQAEAFEAIDHAFGLKEFSMTEALEAIVNETGVNYDYARLMFSDLLAEGHIQ